MMFRPESVEDLQTIIHDHTNLVMRAGGSKPALSFVPEGAVCLDMCGMGGIIEYDPGE
jgi:glycolate oxidase FAD binding subunit